MNTFYFNFPTFLRSTQSCHTLITYSHLPLILVLVKGWLHGKLAPVWPVEELTQYQHACNILIVLGNWRTGPILGPSRPCLAAGVCISYNYRMERIWSNGKETYRHFLLYVLAALLFIIFLTTHRHGRLMWHRHLTILSRIFRLKNNISSYQFYFCHLTHDNGPFKLLWHSLLLFFGTSALFRLCY